MRAQGVPSHHHPPRAHQAAHPVRWDRKKVTLLVPPPTISDLDHKELTLAVTRAAHAWRDRDLGISIEVEPAFRQLGSAEDGVSTIQVLTQRWCPAGKTGDGECYPRGQVANTTLQSSPWEGRSERKLQEGDIVINGVDRPWQLPKDEAELTAVVVHELGHLLGLHHPCSQGSSGNEACSHYTEAALHPLPLRPSFVTKPRPSDAELQLLRELYPMPGTDFRTFTLGLVAFAALSVVGIFLLRKGQLAKRQALSTRP